MSNTKPRVSETREKPTVKKTVVLHPLMDEYIRKTWAMLIDQGYDANYSTALNSLLLAAAMEGAKEGGLSQETLALLKKFVGDHDLLQHLNLAVSLMNLRAGWGISPR